MSINTSWYDPVCYQFFFYTFSNLNKEQSLLEACKEFVADLMPFYDMWISKNGWIWVEEGMERGFRSRKISTTDALEKYRETIISNEPRSLKLSLLPAKILGKFAAPGRSIAKAMKDQVENFTDLRKLDAIDKNAQKEWFYHLMTCPTDDLRGLFFPKRCYFPREMFLNLTYETWSSQGTAAYINELLKDVDMAVSDSGVPEPYYLHRIHVSIPRFMLDAMDQPFSLQSTWKKRMITLCEPFENSVGYMKMDVCDLKHWPSILSGSGRFLPGFSDYLPDIAWGMCLTKKQVQALGGIERLRDTCIFHDVETLRNGKLYLQHTQDISIVTKKEAVKLWNLLSHYLRYRPHCSYSVGETPVSFRMGIDYDKLQMNDYGEYTISE